MTAKVFSCSFLGLECQTIEVQADISNGLSTFSIVGLGDASVQEAKERVRSSIKNSGLFFPQTRKTINLAPAQIKKQGSLFDLPIAISILLASGQIQEAGMKNTILIGELSLNGEVKRVNGALPLTQHAKEKGFKRIMLPQENVQEASFIEGIEIIPIKNIKDVVLGRAVPQKNYDMKKYTEKKNEKYAFSKVIGHHIAKRVLEVAAAGHHNLMLHGSPGCGKTILARALQDLTTSMTKDEILETTKVFSIAGLLKKDEPLIVERPFREVHHTASCVSVIGGGALAPRPGEISLAHNGVLFLDEIAEFPKQVLEAMRQPLEDGYINIARSHFSTRFPSNFLLVATMNPCPCGYKNDKKIDCICTEAQRTNYKRRVSGPIIDRFDLFIEIEKIHIAKFMKIKKEEEIIEENEIIKRIDHAKTAQQKRGKKNSDLSIKDLQKFCKLTPACQAIIKQASKNLNLSNRGYIRTLRVARTIADLDQKEKISQNHLAEAIQYRQKNLER